MFIRQLAASFAVIISMSTYSAATAQSPSSECLAIAQNLGARYQLAALQPDQAQITYVGHSTFVIESPQGIRAATDFSGYAGGVVPDIVTMNRAHSSHYTDFPDHFYL